MTLPWQDFRRGQALQQQWQSLHPQASIQMHNCALNAYVQYVLLMLHELSVAQLCLVYWDKVVQGPMFAQPGMHACCASCPHAERMAATFVPFFLHVSQWLLPLQQPHLLLGFHDQSQALSNKLLN